MIGLHSGGETNARSPRIRAVLQQMTSDKPSFLDHVLEVFKRKLPVWAVLLIVLFGSGGVFYSAYDFLEKRPVKKRTYNAGGPTLALINVKSSFFPPRAVELANGLYVEVTNDSNDRNVPNLRVVLDANTGKIQNCDVETPAAQSGQPGKTGDSIFSMTAKTFAPHERIGIYCLVAQLVDVSVSINSTDDAGNALGSNQFKFGPASRETANDTSSAFEDFLWVLLGAILVAIALCIIVVVFGLAGRLFKILRIWQ